MKQKSRQLETGNTRFDRELVVFAHMPKAGGTSLVRSFQKNLPSSRFFLVRHNRAAKDMQRFRELPREKCTRISLLHGHAVSSLIPELDQPFWAFTILRDPAERVRSFYYYVQSASSHPLHARYRNASFEEFVRGEKMGEAGNHQMRVLARAVPEVKEYRDSKGRFFYTPGEDPAAIVERYADPISGVFSFIGLLERYDESVLLLSHELGLPPIHYTKRNVTYHGRRHEPLTESQRAMLEDILAPEILFYRRAANRLDERIAALGSDFQILLSEYRVVNPGSRPRSRAGSVSSRANPRRGDTHRSTRLSTRPGKISLPPNLLRHLPSSSTLPPAYGLMK